MEETRILRLEERVAWLEKHVLEQDRVMMAMGEDLAKSRKLYAELRERVRGIAPEQEGSSPLDERPPHY